MRCEKNPASKLNNSDVLEICAQLDAGIPRRTLAKKYLVSDVTIGLIARGDKWQWLTGRKRTE